MSLTKYQRIKELNYMASRVSMAQHSVTPLNYPVRMAVEVTSKCNFHCIMCNQMHSTTEINFDYMKVLDDALPFARDLVITGGEPLMYSRLFEIAEKCKKNGTIASMNTNGSLFGKDDNLENLVRYMGEIRISIDAGTPKTYKSIRNNDGFDTLIENIAKMSKLKQELRQNTPELIFTFVGMRRNLAELSRLVLIAKHIGVSRINANYLFLGGDQHHLLDESPYGCQEYSNNEILKAYVLAQKNNIAFRVPQLFEQTSASADAAPRRSPCAWPWEYFELYSAGTSAVCCGGAGSCGDASKDSFDQMWNHPVRQEVRRTVNTPHELPCCKNCGSSTQKRANNLRSFVAGGDEQELLRYLASLPDEVN